MKNVIIIEDEKPAADRLARLVNDLGDVTILTKLDSIEDSVNWLKSNSEPDLIFCDIQLADGKSFNIFEKVNVKCPIIFTTAYDNYAIRAFKLNSIDYLLKPIDNEELKTAWQKFLALNQPQEFTSELVLTLRESLHKKPYKERFLVRSGEQFKNLKDSQISYFFSDGGQTFLIDQTGEQFLFDKKLDDLEEVLDPKKFHRISRKFIVKENSINKITNHLNNRLVLELKPTFKGEVLVSRERVTAFKSWLGSY